MYTHILEDLFTLCSGACCRDPSASKGQGKFTVGNNVITLIGSSTCENLPFSEALTWQHFVWDLS